jgi:metallo-beta-lactamase family protein
MANIRLTFFGAAETVTGSRYLLEFGTTRVLVDCGLFQGPKELRQRNWEPFPVEAKSISAVLFTHAHIDHIGYLPVLVRQGFRGPVYCPTATADLAKILLADSAKLQEEEAGYAEKVGSSKHHPPLPLYDRKDAERAVKLLQTIPFYQATEILPGIRVLPRQAGHILGSANLTVDCKGTRITFSGDIGRYNMPLLPDPEPAEFGDLLLCESTYGDRFHSARDLKAELLEVVQESILRKGPLIIPAFALGRTQTVVHYLSELEREGRIPSIPVFIDSPMAADVTAIYQRYSSLEFSGEKQLLKPEPTPLSTGRMLMCRSTQQSKEINGFEGSRIIIAASGMVNGGRILHHMMHNLPNPDTTILFVGYQSPGTRGEIIQSGASEVKIFGKYIPIQAHIRTISGLSAHADKGELLRWLRSCSGTPQTVKIVHGEKEVASRFAETVQTELGWKASAARHEEVIEL